MAFITVVNVPELLFGCSCLFATTTFRTFTNFDESFPTKMSDAVVTLKLAAKQLALRNYEAISVDP